MYKGGAFVFSFVINMNYPHEPPKVKCTQTVGRVSLAGAIILRQAPLDISPERGSRRERLPKHSQRRLEASPQSELGNGRITILVLRAECRRPIEQR
jgi:hypothetical protein